MGRFGIDPLKMVLWCLCRCLREDVKMWRRLDQPVCAACQSPLTVKHFLIECVNFAAIRSSMKDVFENVKAQSVIDFI